MGIFDDFGTTFEKLAGQVDSGALPQLFRTVLKRSDFGDLQTLVSRLQQGGLTERVGSWVGQQPAASVSAHDIAAALGDDRMSQLSQAFGLTPSATSELLASKLPQTVSEASRHGEIAVRTVVKG